MRVESPPIDGTYEELLDVAEDIAAILGAIADSRLDLTPTAEHWLVDELALIELALARHFDADPV